MKILYSYECMEILPEVAKSLYNEWKDIYEFEGENYNTILKELEESKDINKLPITLVAIEDGKFVGTVAIIKNDMVGREDLFPWIANLFIVKEYRNKGVIKKLFERVEQEVRRMKFNSIFIYTEHHYKIYERMGFEVIDKVLYNKRKVVILKRNA